MFGLFKKKDKSKERDGKSKQTETQNYLQKECDYSSLTEITSILTNGDVPPKDMYWWLWTRIAIVTICLLPKQRILTSW